MIEHIQTEPLEDIDIGMSLSRKGILILKLNEHAFSLDAVDMYRLLEGLSKSIQIMMNDDQVIRSMMGGATNGASKDS